MILLINSALIKSLLLIFLISLSGQSCETSIPDDHEFVKNTYTFALKYGLYFQTTEIGLTNGCYYIPDDYAKPYAVLKPNSKCPKKQAFISHYAHDIGFNNVALSFYVENMPIMGQEKPFQGLIEEYITFFPKIPTILPLPTLHFFNQHQMLGCVNLCKVYQSFSIPSTIDEDAPEYPLISEKCGILRTSFRHQLRLDSCHQFFLLCLLTSNEDSEPRNIALRHNNQGNGQEYDLVNFDTEQAFSPFIFLSYAFNIPYMKDPISEITKSLMLNWTSEKNEKYKEEMDLYAQCGKEWQTNKFTYKNQSAILNNIKDCLIHIKNASPEDILFFAFYRTPLYLNFLEVYHCNITSLISSWSKDNKFNYLNKNTIGFFFKETYISHHAGYYKAIVEYNKVMKILNQENDLSFQSFLDFIPTLPYFKQDLTEAYRQFVDLKFGLTVVFK